MSGKKRRFFVAAFLLAMTGCNLTLLFRVLPKLHNGYQDFTIFYTGARLLRNGQAGQLYDLATQYRMQQTFTDVPIRLGPLPFNHPPFEAVLFVPFTFLNYWTAYLVWTALNLVMLAATILLLRRNFPQLTTLSPLIMGLAATAFFPVTIGLIQGQDIVLLLFLFVLAVVCLNQNRDTWAGVFLGLGLFRPQWAVPLALLMGIRRWRVFVGFAPVAIALLGVSMLLTGWSGPLEYVHFVVHLEGNDSRAFGPEAVPNLRGLIAQLPGFGPASAWAGPLLFISSVIVFLVTVRRICVGRDSIIFASSLAVVTTILVAFHTLVYDCSLLLPMLLFLLAQVSPYGESDRTTKIVPGPADASRILLLTLWFLTPLYILLLMTIDRFFLFSFIVLWLYIRLLRTTAPAEVPV